MIPRILLVPAIAIFIAAPASARVDLTDPEGFLWDIQDDDYGEIGNGTTDAYDNWPQMCVTLDQALPSTSNCTAAETYNAGGVAGTLELAGRQVATKVESINGLNVQRKIFVPDTGLLGFCRYMEVLQNPTASTISVKLRIGSVDGTYADLGSDGGTTVTSTSDGSGILGPGLTFFTTDDASDGAGDPSMAHVMGSAGAFVPVSDVRQNVGGQGTDGFYWEYANVSIPSGATVVLLHFQSQQQDRAGSQAISEDLQDPLSIPEALFGVTSEELGGIVNFPLGPDSDGDGSPDSVDCEPNDPTIHPGAVEVVGDGVDSDCDGFDGVDCYDDLDLDGYGVGASYVSGCVAANQVSIGGDCDDNDPNAYPGAPEISNDGIDQDCDGFDLQECYLDADSDGFGAGNPTGNTLCTAGESPFNGDCDDADPSAYPGGVEINDDGVDQDCDGYDLVTCFSDADGDAFGVGASFFDNCEDPGEAIVDGDCDDADPSINPLAPEIPGDGIDQDCNGTDDIECWDDLDQDGYGGGDSYMSICDANDQTTQGGDCDDTNAGTYPGAFELPDDGVDQDCNGGDTISCWPDLDADGYGQGEVELNLDGVCQDDWVNNDFDCDDTNPDANPQGSEECGNDIDEDCDGAAPPCDDDDGGISAPPGLQPGCSCSTESTGGQTSGIFGVIATLFWVGSRRRSS